MALLAYRAECCSSCGWHEGDPERGWGVTERLCIGCRMLDEAKPGEGEARKPSYVHHEIHRVPDEEQDPDE